MSEDDLYEQAKELVLAEERGSTSLLQKRLRIGYARAGALMDALEADGIVGPPRGTKDRMVLSITMKVEELKRVALEDDETFLEQFYELGGQEPFVKVTLNAWELQTILEMKDHMFTALTDCIKSNTSLRNLSKAKLQKLLDGKS